MKLPFINEDIFKPYKSLIQIKEFSYTPSVPVCLSSIPFWDVLKYCPVSKNKNY